MNPDTLRQLIANCRRSDRRYLGWPRDWAPYSINNPDSPGFTFTDASAWEFIANKLESRHPFEEIVLENPKGANAVVLLITLTESEPRLYVKIQLGKGNAAIGRSFHHSYN